jgi:hypothetical protein
MPLGRTTRFISAIKGDHWSGGRCFQKAQNKFRFDPQEEVVGSSGYAKRILHQS